MRERPLGRHLLMDFQKGFGILADAFQVKALIKDAEDTAAAWLAVQLVGFLPSSSRRKSLYFLKSIGKLENLYWSSIF